MYVTPKLYYAKSRPQKESFYYVLKFSFIFGCVGSSLLHTDFLQLQLARAALQFHCTSFALQWCLLLQSTGSRMPGLLQLWSLGLVALRYVESSQTKDQIKSVSPVLAGRFLTIGPPVMSVLLSYIHSCLLLRVLSLVGKFEDQCIR